MYNSERACAVSFWVNNAHKQGGNYPQNTDVNAYRIVADGTSDTIAKTKENNEWFLVVNSDIANSDICKSYKNN